MGTHKAGLVAGGRTLLDRISEEVAAVCSSVALIGGTAETGETRLPDAVENLGPAGGILTALRQGAEWSLIVACDMPGVTRGVFERLTSGCARTAVDCVISIGPDGREHPLCAVYHQRCLSAWEAAVSHGTRKVRDIIRGLRVVRVLISDPDLLRNVNTPADWQEYLAHGR